MARRHKAERVQPMHAGACAHAECWQCHEFSPARADFQAGAVRKEQGDGLEVAVAASAGEALWELLALHCSIIGMSVCKHRILDGARQKATCLRMLSICSFQLQA